MARAGLYVRVSTEEQAKEGFSVAAQLRLLQAFAVVKGCGEGDVENFVDDGYSGKNLRRPAIQRLIGCCQARRLDYVIVWRLDRLSRSLRDTLALEEDVFRANGVQFISTSESIDTSSPSGRLMLNLLASVAQNEREVNEERVRMVCAELAKECRHMGGVPPYGYRVEQGRYAIAPHEAEAVRLVYQLYDRGMTGRRIQAYLTEHGYLNREGKPFSIASLHDMRRNEKYNGTYVYNRTVAATRSGKRNNHASKPDGQIIRIPGGMPAVVPMDLWRRVQEKMDKNQHTGGRNNAKTPYLLSGLIYCGVCGRHMTAQVSGRDRNGTLQRRYACPDKCVKRIRKEKAEAYVLDYLRQLADDPALVQHAINIANDFAGNEYADHGQEVEELETRLKEIETKLRGVIDFIASAGASAPSSLMDEIRDLESEQARIQQEIVRLTDPPISLDAELLLKGLRQVAALTDQSMEEQKKAIAQIVRRVAVFDDHLCVYLDNANCGGGEGNRTPVRKPENLSFSERSPRFCVPSAQRPRTGSGGQ